MWLSQGSLFVRGESLFRRNNNVGWTANISETVRENALTREDDDDCQSHSHLHADDVVEIVDVRICETSRVLECCQQGDGSRWVSITETSQKDDSSIPNFLHYDDTHIAETPLASTWDKHVSSFCHTARCSRTNTAAVDRVTERIMTIKYRSTKSTLEDDDFGSAPVAESAVSSRGTQWLSALERKMHAARNKNSAKKRTSDVAVRPCRSCNEQYSADFGAPREAA